MRSADTDPNKPQSGDGCASMIAVFVPREDQHSIISAHMPLLVKAASLGSGSDSQIRLVRLPKGADARLSMALGVPCVGAVGLMEGAPGAEDLIGVLRDEVGELVIPWLEKASSGVYRPVNIQSIETTSNERKRKKTNQRKIERT